MSHRARTLAALTGTILLATPLAAPPATAKHQPAKCKAAQAAYQKAKKARDRQGMARAAAAMEKHCYHT